MKINLIVIILTLIGVVAGGIGILKGTKQETKIKIIRWVKKLLNYKEVNGVPFIIEERKIQKIRLVHIVPRAEEKYYTKEEIEKNVSLNILTLMIHIGAIKFEWTDLEDGKKKMEATTYVPEKL